jgi:hypothetical protein
VASFFGNPEMKKNACGQQAFCDLQDNVAWITV